MRRHHRLVIVLVTAALLLPGCGVATLHSIIAKDAMQKMNKLLVTCKKAQQKENVGGIAGELQASAQELSAAAAGLKELSNFRDSPKLVRQEVYYALSFNLLLGQLQDERKRFAGMGGDPRAVGALDQVITQFAPLTAPPKF